MKATGAGARRGTEGQVLTTKARLPITRLDDLVRPCDNCGRDPSTGCLGGPEVDHELHCDPDGAVPSTGWTRRGSLSKLHVHDDPDGTAVVIHSVKLIFRMTSGGRPGNRDAEYPVRLEPAPN